MNTVPVPLTKMYPNWVKANLTFLVKLSIVQAYKLTSKSASNFICRLQGDDGFVELAPRGQNWHF